MGTITSLNEVTDLQRTLLMVFVFRLGASLRLVQMLHMQLVLVTGGLLRCPIAQVPLCLAFEAGWTVVELSLFVLEISLSILGLIGLILTTRLTKEGYLSWVAVLGSAFLRRE